MSVTHSSLCRVTATEKRRKSEISELAIRSFEAIQPFVNVFDCGLKLGGILWPKPFHLITKEDWRLYALHKQGQAPRYPDGRRFNPYQDVVRNIFCPDHVQEMLDGDYLRYYTSGKQGSGLLYADVDAHAEWQDDQQRAKELLAGLFPAFWRISFRGENGYIKSRYSSWAEFNDTADFIQERLTRWLRSQGILCDFEIKGTITTKEKSGRLWEAPVRVLELRSIGRIQGRTDRQCVVC